MSSRNLHVQDNVVAERRLRPIYDWLDSGNNKKALQECEKVLKKTPNLHCAKALKALAYHRIGKEVECIEILDNLTAENPADDATLQAMSLCCREMQQLSRICKLYETAVKLDPTNEELNTHLFMSYVRTFDFKSQQQAAMTLYKHKPKNPYYCWAVMSIILQATRGEGLKDPVKKRLLLSLAERMMDKQINEKKLDAEQEIELYVMILSLQDKHKEILSLFDGPLGEKLACTNMAQERLKYNIKLEAWQSVNLLCKQILNEHVDRWDIWKEYLNSVFCIIKNNCANHQDNHLAEEVDDSPEKAHEFICRIIENATGNGFLLRGPFLARFELAKRMRAQNLNSIELLGDEIELFIEYFRKFGHKPCCVSDLCIYLSILNEDQQCDLAAKLIKDIGISSTSVPESEVQMRRHISALQLSRLCGVHRNLSTPHLKVLVKALTLHYQHGYQTYGSNLLSTDLGPSDAYALIAAHTLYDIALAEQNSSGIINAISLLDNVLQNSPSNFHCKLLSIRLNHTVGNGLGAYDMYVSLDVKNLQLDSLGYIHCARLLTTGLFSLCNLLFDLTLKFFSASYKDSSDHLTYSYKFGSFLKLDQFMDFRERLNNSLHYTGVIIDRIMLGLIECTNMEGLYNMDISPKDEEIEWELLRDNHDLSVYMSWDPERVIGSLEVSDDVQRLYQQDLCFLKMRSSVLFALNAAVNVVKSSDGVREKYLTSLRTVLNEWKTNCDALNLQLPTLVPIKQNQVVMPLISRLHGYLNSPYNNVVASIFEFFYNLVNESANGAAEVIAAVKQLTMFRLVMTSEELRDFQQRRSTMESFVNMVEILTVCVFVCLLCNDFAKPVQQGKKNKQRKSNDSKNRQMLNEIVIDLKNELNATCASIDKWSEFSSNMAATTDDITNNMAAFSLQGDVSSVTQSIVNSYQTACKELQGVLKAKIKMLSAVL